MSGSESAVVMGAAASHTTLMNTNWADVDDLPEAHRFRNALRLAAEALAASRPDLVVIVGSNHFRGFFLDLMPSFTIGVGQVIGAGEHGTPAGLQRSDPDAALGLCQGLLHREFDVAFSNRLEVDHGITHAIQYLLPDVDVPVVPVVVNTFAPPLPTLARCVALGAALRTSLEDLPGQRRVAVIGTGGLSHALPWPDWRRPEGPDEEFMVEAFGARENWRDYTDRRRQLVRGAPSSINTRFDSEVLDLVTVGRLPDLIRYEDTLVSEAGNGSNEVRSWLIAVTAAGNPPGEVLCYSPVERWLTGMAVALFRPEAAPPSAAATRTPETL